MTEQEEKHLNEVYQKLSEYEKECSRINARILKAIKSVKGERFYQMVLDEIQESEGVVGHLRFAKKHRGTKQSQPNVWVDQTTNGGYSGDSFAGTVSIKLKRGKFLEWDYSM